MDVDNSYSNHCLDTFSHFQFWAFVTWHWPIDVLQYTNVNHANNSLLWVFILTFISIIAMHFQCQWVSYSAVHKLSVKGLMCATQCTTNLLQNNITNMYMNFSEKNKVQYSATIIHKIQPTKNNWLHYISEGQ